MLNMPCIGGHLVFVTSAQKKSRGSSHKHSCKVYSLARMKDPHECKKMTNIWVDQTFIKTFHCSESFFFTSNSNMTSCISSLSNCDKIHNIFYYTHACCKTNCGLLLRTKCIHTLKCSCRFFTYSFFHKNTKDKFISIDTEFRK